MAPLFVHRSLIPVDDMRQLLGVGRPMLMRMLREGRIECVWMPHGGRERPVFSQKHIADYFSRAGRRSANSEARVRAAANRALRK